MKKLLTLLATVFLLTLPSQGITQETCDEDHICLQKDRAARFLNAAEDLRCLQRQLEEGDIEVTGEPYRIIVDKKGRVFAKDKMSFRVKWCEFDVELQYDPEVEVHRKAEMEKPFGMRLRVRLGVGFNFIPHGDTAYKRPESLVEPMLLIESFYWRFLHAEAHAGLNTFGMGVGVDITRNLDIYTGVGLRWQKLKQVTPLLGTSLSFN